MAAGRVGNVDGAAADGARGGVERADFVERVEHVPVREADLADEDRVVRDVDQMGGVRLGARRVEVVGGARHRRALVRVQVLGRVAHAVDAVVGGEFLLHRRLHCARVPPHQRDAAAAAAAADAADRRLHVDLDAVDARRRQRAVQPAVELVERRAVVGDDAGAEEGHRVPPELRLDL